MDMEKFLALKSVEQQRINFEMTYVDMAGGDLIAGLLLSQIIYWFTPNKHGKSKIKATYKGRPALAKSRDEWYKEIRITKRQYDRAIKTLKEKGIIDIENSMFNSKRTPFIMLNEETFLSLYTKELHRYYTNVNTGIDESVTPLTETTTKTTTETNLHFLWENDMWEEWQEEYISAFLTIRDNYISKQHKRISSSNVEYIKEVIQSLSNNNIDIEVFKEGVNSYFSNLDKDNDGDIVYFMQVCQKRIFDIDYKDIVKK